MRTITTKTYFYIVLAVFAAGLFVLALDAPVDVDEILHNGQAKKVVSWYASAGKDVRCLETPRSYLKFYGQSMDNVAAAINKIFNIQNEYLTRHLLGWGIAVLLLLVTGLLTLELTASHGAAILAMLFLMLSPRPFGQVIDNLKDLPFALGYAWSVLWLIRLIKQLPEFKWKTMLWLGVAIAFTNSIRVGALIFYPYMDILVMGWFLFHFKTHARLLRQNNFWKDLIIKVSALVVLGYFGGLFFWPYGLMNPLKNPIETLTLMQRYAISIRQLFEGEVYWSTSLPWYYLGKWLWISIPEVVWFGVLILPFSALFSFFRGRKVNCFLLASLLFFFLFPVIYVIIIKANLYSGWRQMYFVYVPLLVLSVTGFYNVWMAAQYKGTKIFLVAMLIPGLLLPGIHIFKTIPVHNIYFNDLSGGTKAAWNKYEYDYYWLGMKEASDFLKKEIEGKENITVVSNLSLDPYFYKGEAKLGYVRFYERASLEWDYAVLGVNYIHPTQIKNETWKPWGILKTVYHKGNPLAVVIKSPGADARKGIEYAKQGDHEQAVLYFNQHLKKDVNDINVMAKKAASQMALGDKTGFLKTIERGLSLHPAYEPFFLLLAHQAFEEKNYRKAIHYGEKLLEINERYLQILPLLRDSYKSVNEEDKAKEIDTYLNKYSLNIN